MASMGIVHGTSDNCQGIQSIDWKTMGNGYGMDMTADLRPIMYNIICCVAQGL